MNTKHQFSLEAKTAIVTGAAGYFGRNFAECFLENGAKVVLFDKDEKVNDLASSLKSRFSAENVEHHQVDFYDDDAYRKSLAQVVNNNDSIDVLVNNAFEFSQRTGFNDPSGKMKSISKDQWMRSFESGVYWHALSTQMVAPKMKSQSANHN